jgi:hypothetical protein
MSGKNTKVEVSQPVGKGNTRKIIPVTVLAESIKSISKSMKEMRNSGLKDSAIIVLVQADTGLPRTEIKTIMDSIENLADTYCKK